MKNDFEYQAVFEFLKTPAFYTLDSLEDSGLIHAWDDHDAAHSALDGKTRLVQSQQVVEGLSKTIARNLLNVRSIVTERHKLARNLTLAQRAINEGKQPDAKGLPY